MKIATFNVNGVNGRLPVLLRWLDESKPDVVCLQELKAPQEKFPEAAIAKADYGAIWLFPKVARILIRSCHPQSHQSAIPGSTCYAVSPC
jgi:exodeoxyribonuclease III